MMKGVAMGLAQRLFVNHQHGDSSGWLLNHPRYYELFSGLWLSDGVAASGTGLSCYRVLSPASMY